MNEIEAFDEYLKEWCKKNHKPLPPKGSLNKYWQAAWTEYMKTELSQNYDKYVEQYNNIPLLTKSEQRRQEKEKELKRKQELREKQEQDISEQVDPTETKESNSWEKIQKYLK